MIYQLAEINNDIVTNIFDCSDLHQPGFPNAIRVDNISPKPNIGWSYKDGVFSEPPPPPPEPFDCSCDNICPMDII